jgi:hypothetical protein
LRAEASRTTLDVGFQAVNDYAMVRESPLVGSVGRLYAAVRLTPMVFTLLVEHQAWHIRSPFTSIRYFGTSAG